MLECPFMDTCSIRAPLQVSNNMSSPKGRTSSVNMPIHIQFCAKTCLNYSSYSEINYIESVILVCNVLQSKYGNNGPKNCNIMHFFFYNAKAYATVCSLNLQMIVLMFKSSGCEQPILGLPEEPRTTDPQSNFWKPRLGLPVDPRTTDSG